MLWQQKSYYKLKQKNLISVQPNYKAKLYMVNLLENTELKLNTRLTSVLSKTYRR